MSDSVAPNGDQPPQSARELDGLLPEVYEDLRRIACRCMAKERVDHTLQATALTHEAYLRLLSQQNAKYVEKSHLMALAAQAMRRILVDHARSKGRKKRGGDQVRVTIENFDQIPGDPPSSPTDLIELDEALHRLAEREPRRARVVEMLYIGGMSTSEAAVVLDVTRRTVERDWELARTWLAREMN